jgi:hypothetical protein
LELAFGGLGNHFADGFCLALFFSLDGGHSLEELAGTDLIPETSGMQAKVLLS